LSQEIIIHKNQSNIFDIVEDTTSSKVPDDVSAKIKIEPPFHKELFPSVNIVQISRTNYLALILNDKSYDLEFYHKNKNGTFNAFKPKTKLKIFKLQRDNINSSDFVGKLNFMMEGYSSFFWIDNEKIKNNIEQAYENNDFDTIFENLKNL